MTESSRTANPGELPILPNTKEHTSATERRIRDALAFAGAWSDLDWDEMESTLLRQRREVPPTPPYRES